MKKFIKNILLILPFLVLAQTERVQVEGDYSYTYGDNESLLEAKNICYSMAVRNAIEGYRIFISSTTNVNNFQLVKDLIQTISSGYLEDLAIVTEEIKGRNVHYKIRAFVRPDVVREVIQREVRKSKDKGEFKGIENGRYLKILSIRKKEGKIHTIIQKKGDEYEDSLFKEDYVMIDYFDSDGFPIGGNKVITERKLKAGEIRDIIFTPPKNVVSYRAWLTE
jgi:hypothetical protein